MSLQNDLYLLNAYFNKIITDSLAFWNDHLFSGKTVIADRSQHTWDELKASGNLGLINNDSLINGLYKFYSYYDSRIANFNQLPLEVRFNLRETQGRTHHLIDIDRFHLSGFTKSPSKGNFIRILNDQKVREALALIMVSSIYNIPWFEELLIQSQSIVKYMEENIPEVIEQEY